MYSAEFTIRQDYEPNLKIKAGDAVVIKRSDGTEIVGHVLNVKSTVDLEQLKAMSSSSQPPRQTVIELVLSSFYDPSR